MFEYGLPNVFKDITEFVSLKYNVFLWVKLNK